eukprot:scaffold73440_cov13-Tisochrysis_lutea.AAC.2
MHRKCHAFHMRSPTGNIGQNSKLADHFAAACLGNDMRLMLVSSGGSPGVRRVPSAQYVRRLLVLASQQNGTNCCSPLSQFLLVSSVAGVKHASVALLQETAEVEFDEGVTEASALVEAVEDCGFDASLVAVQGSKQREGGSQ